MKRMAIHTRVSSTNSQQSINYELRGLTSLLKEWAASCCTLKWRVHDPRVSIKIEEDSPGLAAEQCEATFQSSARLDNVTAGSGLGLAISRVDAHADLYRRRGLAAEIYATLSEYPSRGTWTFTLPSSGMSRATVRLKWVEPTKAPTMGSRP